MNNVRIGSEERDKGGSESWVFLCELECQRGKDEVEVTSVLNTPRTEERCSETAISEDPFCDCLRDGRFSSPGESIEPEHGGRVQASSPTLDLVQHALACSLQATIPIPMLIPSPMSTVAAV